MFRHIRILFLFVFLSGILHTGIAFGQTTDTLNRLDNAGKKHGYWRKIERDTLRYEGRFDHGKPVGKFIYYFGDGDIKAITHFSQGGTYASTTLYYTRDHVWATGYYLNEKKDSLWRYYDYNGLLLKEERYSNGVAQGAWIVYFGNGKPSDVTSYRNGLKHGVWTQYFEEGAIQSKATYADGSLEGLMSVYHPNGKLKTSGRYVAGVKTGVWMTYNEEGKGIRKDEFQSGTLIKSVNLVP
jgi:antitoxin component YwqK of YwqJK toxin-antitoxin module